MSVREVIAKKKHSFSSSRSLVLGSLAALLVAACSHAPAPSPAGPEPGGPTAPGSMPGTPPPSHIPGAAPPPPAPLPTSPTAKPLPAPVSRPANRPPLEHNKNFSRVAWNQLPGWQTDQLNNAWAAFLENCRSVMLRTGKTAALTAPATVDAYAWQKTCVAARELPAAPEAGQVRTFLEKWLQPWVVRGANGEAATSVATGYYEPLVHASRERGGDFQWPLYAVPADLLTIDLGSLYPELTGKRVRGKLDGKRVVPYDTRSEIDLPERQPPAIVWVNDPVDAFFLQVQGTGRANLDAGAGAGGTVRLAYADHNGHPYVSIGKWLIDKGEMTIAQASMQGIRNWARRNPNRVKEMLNANPAVVFFREEVVTNAEEGPRGAFGVALTAQRSIAVDPAIVPLGSPVFLATTQPNSKLPMNHLMLAQDTGSAIKGPARADVFWGYGDEAGERAGRMKQASRMWVLWPKGEGAPAPAAR